jgi:hypothetical protein
MEFNIDHTIPMWGLICAIAGGVYFIMQIQSRMLLLDRRIEMTEDTLEKIEEKFTTIEKDIKDLLIEIRTKGK